MDRPHLVRFGDLEFAEELCTKLRKVQAQCPLPDGATVYAIVPLPVTHETDGGEDVAMAFLSMLWGRPRHHHTEQQYDQDNYVDVDDVNLAIAIATTAMTISNPTGAATTVRTLNEIIGDALNYYGGGIYRILLIGTDRCYVGRSIGVAGRL